MPSPQQKARRMAAGYFEIEPQAAFQNLKSFRIVDVRQPDEFDGPLGHIAGAKLAPLTGFPAVAAGLRDEAPLLVVCRSGGRSSRAAEYLAQRGFTQVYNLSGGMMGWNDAGLPVETAEAPSFLALDPLPA